MDTSERKLSRASVAYMGGVDSFLNYVFANMNQGNKIYVHAESVTILF